MLGKKVLRNCGFEELAHFHLFPSLKGHLHVKHFEDDNELKTATEECLYEHDKTFI